MLPQKGVKTHNREPHNKGCT